MSDKTLEQHDEDVESCRKWLPIKRDAIAAVKDFPVFCESILYLLEDTIDAYDALKEARR